MRALLRWLSSWLALLGLWLAFVGTAAPAETTVGALAALLATAALERVRSLRLQSLLPDLRTISSRALQVPREIVVDCWKVTRSLLVLLLRRESTGGRLRTSHLEAPSAASRASATRAFVNWLASIAPNDYVLDSDGDRVGMHVLVPSSGTKHPSR